MAIVRYLWLLVALVPVSYSSAIIYVAKKVEFARPDGSSQKIILLGDCHEYLHQVEKENRAPLKKITCDQRDEIIKLAKTLHATVLIEDMEYGTPHNIVSAMPTMITLAMDRYFGCYEHQVITNLTTECHKNGIAAYSIECRHAASIVGTPPPYIHRVQRAIQRWAPWIGTALTSISCFVSNYMCPLFITATTMCAKPFLRMPPSTVLLGSLNFDQYIENKAIIAQAKELQKSVPFYTTPPMRELITTVEEKLHKKPNYAIFRLVDLKALNFIAQHPEIDTFMICAGSWHNDNLIELFERAGYKASSFVNTFVTPKPIEINASGDFIRPLALGETLTKPYTT